MRLDPPVQRGEVLAEPVQPGGDGAAALERGGQLRAERVADLRDTARLRVSRGERLREAGSAASRDARQHFHLRCFGRFVVRSGVERRLVFSPLLDERAQRCVRGLGVLLERDVDSGDQRGTRAGDADGLRVERQWQPGDAQPRAVGQARAAAAGDPRLLRVDGDGDDRGFDGGGHTGDVSR